MSETPSPEWAELTALEHSRINPYQTWCHDICFGAGVRERLSEPHRGARDREYAFWTIPNLNSSSALTSFTSYDTSLDNTLTQPSIILRWNSDLPLGSLSRTSARRRRSLPGRSSRLSLLCFLAPWTPSRRGTSLLPLRQRNARRRHQSPRL